MGTVAAFKAAASAISSRIQWGNKVGLTTFGGKRDVSEALGYAGTITPEMYRVRFDRNEIAATVVEAMPKAVWRGGGELVEDEDPDTVTPFEEAWFTLADRVKVWPRLLQADIMAGIGRFSVVLIGAPGTLETELPKMKNQDAVAFLSVFSESDIVIKPEDLVDDPMDARFGRPKFYQFKRLDPKSVQKERKVHWTRVVHVADGLLDNSIYGQPRMQRVWNRLDDLEKVVGAGCEAYWQNVQRGMQLDLDKDVAVALSALPDEGKAVTDKLTEELDEYVHGMRRWIRTSGMKLKELGADVSDFHQQVDALLMLISAGTRIPKRILTGSEMGELASSQDKENWNERVSDRREHFAGPEIVRPLVDRLIELGALPKPAEYQVRWPEIENLTEAERAEIAYKYALTNQANSDLVVEVNEIRDRVLGLPPLDDDELALPAIDDETLEVETVDADGQPLLAARARLRVAKLVLQVSKRRRLQRAGIRVAAKKKSPRPALYRLPPTGTSERRGAS